MRYSGVATVLAAGMAWSCASSDRDGTVEGLWMGAVEHQGQASTFGLRLEGMVGDSVSIRLSMPAIGVFDMPLGKAAFDGRTLRFGGWAAVYDEGADVLRGSVPPFLLPIYDVPFALRRTEDFEPTPPLPPAPTPEPIWRYETGAPVWGGVAVDADLVFVGNDDGTVTALGAADGSVAWTHQAGGRIRGTPSVGSGGLYVHADDGMVICLDPTSGEVRWRDQVGGRVARVPPGETGSQYDSYASSVLVSGATAFVGTHEGDVVALDAATGRERWRRVLDGPVVATPSVEGGRLYVSAFSGSVFALDAETGGEVWSVATGAPLVSTPAVAGELLVVGNRAYDLLGLRTEDGTTAWTYYYWFSWVESSARILDGVAYVGSSDAQRLNALDAATGRLLWSARTGGSTWARPAVDSHTVYVGTVGVADYIVEHQGYFLAVDRPDGSLRWRFEATPVEGSPTWGFASSPAVGDQAVFVGGLDGGVYAFPLG